MGSNSEYNFLARYCLRRKKQEIPSITPYLISSSNPAPVIIVAPGGGYAGRAPHEGEPVALWLNTQNISAFILNYRYAPYRFPVPFLDAQRAIRFIRYNADRFNIDPLRCGILGFSAGGHLSSMLGTLPERNWFPEDYMPDDIDSISDLPTLLILCYPVISMQTLAHEGCRRNLVGKNPDPKLVDLVSTEKQVSATTPPTFIWTTRNDAGVPYQHSEFFANALQQNGIE
ncbi:MAG TPA: alpha/beta hydrolase, partial [Candidatus Lokiarchaeia archaeon]|nr:alpha/beta hydrolase [Candidatus Lokiarchaeia archaeon]